VYVATEFREKPLDEHLRLIREAVAPHDTTALKIKVGTLMFMTTDMNDPGPVGKTERLIPRVREMFPNLTLYADANSYYSVPEAIRVGRILEEHKFAYFEEPVMYDDFEAIKAVADALELPVANGEQDQSFVNFRWLLANEGLDVVQPDNYYFGGLTRSLQVARMAEAMGKEVIPHMSGGGLGYVYNLHFAAAMSNAGAHHEFKGFRTHVPFECPTSPLKMVRGKIKVPTGPGWGVNIDPDFVRKHEVVKA
jgi:L-alanine-DL-glutamate epimerase-like enolase superfamily enzyme